MRKSATLILKSCVVVLLFTVPSQAQEGRGQTQPGRGTGPVNLPGQTTFPRGDDPRINLPGTEEPRQQPRITGVESPTLGEQVDIWGRPRATTQGELGGTPPPQPPPPGPVGCPGCQPPGLFRLGQTAMFDLGSTVAGSAAKAQARVLRGFGGTSINLEINGLAGSASTQFLYLIGRTGEVTKVGTVKVENGKATVSAQTQLDKFMIAVSPEDNLTAIGPTTKVSLITGVPDGFTFSQRQNAMKPVYEASDKTSYANVADSYKATMLGVRDFKPDTETRLRIVFLETFDTKGEAVITPRSIATTVKAVISLPRDTVPGTRFVLWAVTPGQTYTRLGQAKAGSQGGELIIEAETPLRDFGLLVTTETVESPPLPAGPTVAIVVKQP
ncbi:MAG TPA: hypothetical protein VJS44_15515 [Pyrinomonadaceae bacterium]|nr:hypothetical protein [Pyrinomonadaceae bacterium]